MSEKSELLSEGLYYGACRCTACAEKLDLSHCETREEAADAWESHLESCPEVELKVGDGDGEWITMSDDEPDREWSDWRVA